MSTQETNSELAGLQTKALLVGALGLAAAAAGFAMDSEQFYRSYLTGYLYWLAPTLGCLGWTMIYHLTAASWGVPARRIWESAGRTMPLMGILAIPVVMGMQTLFPWARPEAVDDALIQAKVAFLNEPFFLARVVFYVVLWSAIGILLSRWSLQQDTEGPQPAIRKLRALSGAGLVLMALSLTFFSVDFVMSLDPHWFSTIFGFLFAAADLLAAMAFTVLAVRFLEKTDSLKKLVNVNTYHDYGNLLLAFIMLWTYMNLSQFLIIWSGNTQEEAPWYLERMGDGWLVISQALIIFHFALPLLFLLTRWTKRNPSRLVFVAVWILVMRFVDLYWLTQPSMSHGGGVHLHWMDLAVLIGLGGLWVGFFAMHLKDKPLLAKNDPRLAEVLEIAGGHH
ncbi:MAG: hypothetical protein O2795_16440 [Acidobacteria bacterium]|nr:hypothetical protein [Acidobacteriota bacterium]